MILIAAPTTIVIAILNIGTSPPEGIVLNVQAKQFCLNVTNDLMKHPENNGKGGVIKKELPY